MTWIAAYLEYDSSSRADRLAAILRTRDLEDEKWGRVVGLIDELRKQAWSHDPVRLNISDHAAHTIADALEHWMNHQMPLYRVQAAIEENIINSAAVADEMMKDELQRFQMVVTDLELLLLQFIGRPPMTMGEVRRQRSQLEARPSSGPQPFVRKKPSVQISEELRRSIATGRIGDPREPGEEG